MGRGNDGSGDPGDGDNSIAKTLAHMGTALGLGMAIMVTPMIFRATRDHLLHYFSEIWPGQLSGLLVWAMGGVEAFLLFATTKVVCMLLTIWLLGWLGRHF